MDSVIFVPHPEVWRREGTPGGLSLLERQLRQLAALGLESPLLLVPAGQPIPALQPGAEALRVARVPAETANVLVALAAAADALPSDFLFLSADFLVDHRVLRALAAGRGPVLVSTDDGVPGAVGRAGAADVRRHGATLAQHAERLALATLDPYLPELRGDVAPYVLAVRTAAEQRAAWRVLLDHVQKRNLDLPGQYFDTPFENFLVRRLAPTRLTPNQITVATTLLAFGVGMLFLRGWLGVGILLALVVGVLDGVDGKLARLKLATSKLGELEHVADFFYENFWYLAIALHLEAATGAVRFWHAGLALVACDLSDNLAYAVVRARTGRMLDELAPFDGIFRKVAGRRNVYVMMLALGFLSGHVNVAFLAVAVWAAVTVAVHVGRALDALRVARRRPVKDALQVPEALPASRVLVSEK